MVQQVFKHIRSGTRVLLREGGFVYRCCAYGIIAIGYLLLGVYVLLAPIAYPATWLLIQAIRVLPAPKETNPYLNVNRSSNE